MDRNELYLVCDGKRKGTGCPELRRIQWQGGPLLASQIIETKRILSPSLSPSIISMLLIDISFIYLYFTTRHIKLDKRDEVNILFSVD